MSSMIPVIVSRGFWDKRGEFIIHGEAPLFFPEKEVLNYMREFLLILSPDWAYKFTVGIMPEAYVYIVS